MKEKNIDNTSLNVKEIKEILELFSKLDERKKELALAALTGMVLVAEAEKKGA